MPYNDWDDVDVIARRRHAQLRMNNSRRSSSVRSEEENNCREDHTKDPEESVDAAVQGRGVWIGFRWHGLGFG